MPRSPRDWLGLIAGVLVVLILLPLVVLLLLLLPFRYYWEYRRANALRREFEARWVGQGKRGILVYSNSPHWKAYIDQRWLPTIGARVVVLNWSERTAWPDMHPFEARLFRSFGGRREFNPIAILFPQHPNQASPPLG